MSRLGKIGLGVAAVWAALVLPGAGEARADQQQQFKDWLMRCQDSGPVSERDCLITQSVVNKSDDLIMAVALYYHKGETKPTIVFSLPPQIDPQESVTLTIIGKATRSHPVEACNERFCKVKASVGDDLLTEMKNGSQALVTFGVVGSQGRGGAMMSLKGFATAIKALQAKRRK